MSNPPFAFVHVGDLHLDAKEGAENARDLGSILTQIGEVTPQGLLDFLYLPGDIAEDGKKAQYKVLWTALKQAHPPWKAGTPIPIYLIPGDHDRQYGTMTAFGALFRKIMRRRPVKQTVHPNGTLRQFYYAETINGVRCLFLDLCSAGYGEKKRGLDFRVGGPQRDWLTHELRMAQATGMPCAVFMHTYPVDLRKDERTDVAGLIRAGGVRLVEMGHTHYNELSPDGVTLYAAARSVGQNEDGSVGYAVAAIDGDAVSWRFKPLDRTWPFVLITSPADRRLATAGRTGGHATVRALVLTDQAAGVPGKAPIVECRIDAGFWHLMARAAGDRCHQVILPCPAHACSLSVRARDPDWDGQSPDLVDVDVVELAEVLAAPPARTGTPGSDASRVGAWLEKGVRGDQLGPNRNGRSW